MLPKWLFKLAGIGASCCLCQPAFSDQIKLKNGDVLTGEIIKKEATTVLFKTGYAGELKVQWSEVESITSDNPVHIVLSDGSNWHGELVDADPGAALLKLDTAAGEKSFDLLKTRYINPAADLLKDAIKWTGHVNAGGALSHGNNETKGLRFDGETIARTRHNRLTVGGEFNRTQDRGRNTQFDSQVYGKYDHFLSPHWYAYANTSFENDRFRDLRLRSMAGVGSGYQVFETPNLNLSLEGGLNYVAEDNYRADDRRYPGVRWAVKYDQMLFGSTKLFHEHEVLADIQETSHILLSSKTGLRFPPIFNFNATAQLNLDWDNQPSPSREQVDSTLLFNLGYGW